ncbi:basic secretory protein-like protein [Roseibacillus persicicus]|uniref:Secretory protein n=1 Tax=Roseibacillus persicicus TaxID=454148 RepID=A0A918TI91_9BACT|nr:basic secretory protein-like protein [Roseibacillus persicicus]GHC50382.1 hypothetical protein GCM10007100_15610 [Roseibacillus persicicus]
MNSLQFLATCLLLLCSAATLFADEQKDVTVIIPDDEKYRYVVDSRQAPELTSWVRQELKPVIIEWYPKMVDLMPSKGYTAPTEVFLEFKPDLGGPPAYAMGNRISMSIPFFKAQLEGEAKGCVIHELVHVIQNFGLARRNPEAKPTPGWITEGLADYVRWFIYEPEKKGALITERNIDSARHDASYRVSANFIDWVTREHDENLLEKLNASAREGRYQVQLWEHWTGKSLKELADLWRQAKRDNLQ